ncbi:hypothetical protein PCANC_27119 [Puccinia coronata f. sp. avenae]|uniref:non-specific serine/threonine protein kinase n=1 Tax=Puccinia coronata f. sp. avenae TaxID=200324 RepID=A0A2N5RUP1_9BASI|nr:hypothetical protein PCANC_27119 [Puccinia coronata f. sp. avenae]
MSLRTRGPSVGWEVVIGCDKYDRLSPSKVCAVETGSIPVFGISPGFTAGFFIFWFGSGMVLDAGYMIGIGLPCALFICAVSHNDVTTNHHDTARSGKLAFVRLNRNRNVYRRTTKPIIIDVDSDSSDDDRQHGRDPLSTPAARPAAPTIISVHSDSPEDSPPRPRKPILRHPRTPPDEDSPLQPCRTQHPPVDPPRDVLKPKPRQRAVFVRTLPHSPVVLIPRLPKKNLETKKNLEPRPAPPAPVVAVPHEAKPPAISPPSPQPNPSAALPVPRVVRGRISMVTGSARRSRYQDWLQRPTAPSSPLKPHHTTQTPHQPVIPISSNKLSNHSPLICHHQISKSNYLPRPIINDGIPSLLKICNQTHILNFTTTVENIERKSILNRFSSSTLRTKSKSGWEKIGEATYSEVFCWSPKQQQQQQLGELPPTHPIDKKSLESKIVLKIIPIKRMKKAYLKAHATTTTTTTTTTSSVVNVHHHHANQGGAEEVGNKSLDNEFPLETDCSDAEKEIKLAKLLGSKPAEGFIDFKGAVVVSGDYPECCLGNGTSTGGNSQNKRKTLAQDLEASHLGGWQQAASILDQVARALSQVEEEYEFEHRDLHWGNLLVHSVGPSSSCQTHPKPKPLAKSSDDDVGELATSLGGIGLESGSSSRPDPLNPQASGVGVSIIDYGLSRAKIVQTKPRHTASGIHRADDENAEILWTDPDQDIFGAVGNDYQFACYDLIDLAREHKPWSAFNPFSNVIWLHYLTKKLIEEKSLDVPTPSSSSTITTTTSLKDRRKTASTGTTRVKKAGTNPRMKGKQERYSTHPSTGAGFGNLAAGPGCVEERCKGADEGRRANMERRCYELLVLSQRFLDRLIQLKMQRINHRRRRDPPLRISAHPSFSSTTATATTTQGPGKKSLANQNGVGSVTQRRAGRPSACTRSSAGGLQAHASSSRLATQQTLLGPMRKSAASGTADEDAEKAALFRDVLEDAVGRDGGLDNHDVEEEQEKYSVGEGTRAEMETRYARVNRVCLDHLLQRLKKNTKKKDGISLLPSYTSFFLLWFAACKDTLFS